MKIASFNINNINRRLPNLLEWLRETEPDVVSLQELKTTDAEFPVKAIRQAGYGAAAPSRRGDVPAIETQGTLNQASSAGRVRGVRPDRRDLPTCICRSKGIHTRCIG